MGYGQNSAVGVVFQNSYGTLGNVDSAHYIPHLTETLQKKIPPLKKESMRQIHDEGDSYEGPHTVEGELSSEVDAISLGAMLKMVLSETSTVNSGGIYTHTFKPRTADFDEKSSGIPLSVYVDRDTSKSEAYQDLNGSVLELSVANGEFLKAKVGFVGGDVSSQASLTAVYPTGDTYTWDVSSASIAAAAIDEFKELTITVDETLEAMHTLDGTKTPNRIKRTGFRTVAIGGTLMFDNNDEKDAFYAQSERPLVLTFEGVEVQSGYNESVTIKLPALRYEDLQGNADGPGEMELAVTAAGKYLVSSATALEIVVVNTQAAY